MPVESSDDRLALLADFGVDAEIGGRVIVGILDNQFEDANGMMVQVPVLTVRTADIEQYDRGENIYIEDTQYTIAEHHVDGLGLTNVILQKT